MNQLPHFKTQSMDWYVWWVDEECNESIFFFTFFFLEKLEFYLRAFCSLHHDLV